jgi:hypothetical protein
MTLNFLENTCSEPVRTDAKFGICDDQDGEKAYSTINTPEQWIATVKNDHTIKLVFTPIDNCLIKGHELIGIRRCDGILTSTQHLYFIELKNQSKNWIANAIEQLESTIVLFKENHNIDVFKHKKAFACKKRHRHFQEIDNELNIAFFRKYKVRIDVQAEILVV